MYFGAICILAARGVPVSDHALTGAMMEWVSLKRRIKL